jgi:energy-coupling factor transport system ATP-binding protein
MTPTVLTLDALPCGHNGKSSLSAELPKGGTLLVVGRCASGKSGIARAIAGIGPHRSRVTMAGVPHGDDHLAIARTVGFVPSNPYLLLSGLAETLRGELALSSRFLGRPVIDRTESHFRLAESLGIAHLLDRDPSTLSGGEMARAAIAIALAKDPEILVLDDIRPALDGDSSALVDGAIGEARRSHGLAVVEMSARCPNPSDVPDDAVWVFLGDERHVIGGRDAAMAEARRMDPFLLPWDGPSEQITAIRLDSGSAVEVRNLSFRYGGNAGFRIGDITADFPKGGATLLRGENGAGKTTLLKCVGNLLRGWEGSITHHRHAPSPSDPLCVWARSATYAFQNPDDQIYLPTVMDEIEMTVRGVSGRRQRIGADHPVVLALGLSGHLDANPMSIPRPLRRMMNVASILAAAPPTVLLDEPTSGLDRRQMAELVPTMAAYMAAGGCVIAVTHDPEFAAALGGDGILMRSGTAEPNRATHPPTNRRR